MAASSLQNSSSTTTPLKSIVWSILGGDMSNGGAPLGTTPILCPPQHLLLPRYQPQELPAHQEQLRPELGHPLQPLHQVPHHLRGGEIQVPFRGGRPRPPRSTAGDITLTRTEKSERQPGARLR